MEEANDNLKASAIFFASKQDPSSALITEHIDQQRERGHAVLSVLPSPEYSGLEVFRKRVTQLQEE